RPFWERWGFPWECVSIPRSWSGCARSTSAASRARPDLLPLPARPLAAPGRSSGAAMRLNPTLRVKIEALHRARRPARDRQGDAVRFQRHRAVSIRAVDAGACRLEPPQDLGRGMAERIARTHGDDGHRGGHGVEKRRRGGVAAAVVPNLQGERSHGGVLREQALLARATEIAGEQQREAAPVEPENQRFFVLALEGWLVEWTRAVRIQDGQER